MVAYSFVAQFREPILAGTKRQTIRADRKRHVRPGETMQLYTGMRTRQCRIIGTAVCVDTCVVYLQFDPGEVSLTDEEGIFLRTRSEITDPTRLDQFAKDDGFAGWSDMQAFWARTHPNLDVFKGVRITWQDFVPGAADG